MPDDAERYAFDKFPRRLLAFNVSRRHLVPALVNDFLVTCESVDGRPAYKLADLGIWQDDQLSVLTPRVVKDCRITVEQGFVFGQPPSAKKPIKLFPLDSPATFAFNLIDGTRSLQEISDSLVAQTRWDSSRSFAYTRGLFLWLVLTCVCQPVH